MISTRIPPGFFQDFKIFPDFPAESAWGVFVYLVVYLNLKKLHEKFFLDYHWSWSKRIISKSISWSSFRNFFWKSLKGSLLKFIQKFFQNIRLTPNPVLYTNFPGSPSENPLKGTVSNPSEIVLLIDLEFFLCSRRTAENIPGRELKNS